MKGVIVPVFALVIIAGISTTSGVNKEPVFCKENRYYCSAKDLKKNKCPLEEEINVQINMELKAFYEYLNLGYYFAHESYNLPHFSKYFLDSAKDEMKHAQDLMHYQVLRGAKVNLMVVAAPKNQAFNSSCEAMKHARDLELSVTASINKIWKTAETLGDIHLVDHLETHFVTEQYESLKKLHDMIGTLERMGICTTNETCSKLGEFQFDKTVMKDLASS